MMSIENNLTPEESKYFETRGESEIPAVAPDAPETPAQPELPLTQSATPEPAKQEVKTEEKKEEKAAAEPPKDDKQPVVVPLAELQAERNRRREEAKKREEAERNLLTLDTRLKTLMEIAKAQAPAAPQDAEIEVPDITVDPVGHFKAQVDILKRQLDKSDNWRKEQERLYQEQQQQATLVNNVNRIGQITMVREAEFRQTNPDYDDASTYLRNMRDAQLKAYGVEDQFQRQQMIQQDAITIAAQALAGNRNPAEVVYEMAKASGWVKKASAPQSSPAPSQQTPPATPPSPQAPSEAEKVAMAAKGQKAGASLGQLNGAASPPLTLESLLKLSDKEFADATKGDKWRKLMS